jgi:hypothetical protein
VPSIINQLFINKYFLEEIIVHFIEFENKIPTTKINDEKERSWIINKIFV